MELMVSILSAVDAKLKLKASFVKLTKNIVGKMSIKKRLKKIY